MLRRVREAFAKTDRKAKDGKQIVFNDQLRWDHKQNQDAVEYVINNELKSRDWELEAARKALHNHHRTQYADYCELLKLSTTGEVKDIPGDVAEAHKAAKKEKARKESARGRVSSLFVT